MTVPTAVISAVTFKDTEPHTISKQQDEKQSIQFNLPTRTNVLIATLLEDCVQQMSILDRCNNELRVMKTMATMTILRTQKYQIEAVEDQDALMNFSKTQLESNQFKLDKLFNDRKYITDVLTQAYLEMAMNGSCQKLKESIKKVEDIQKYKDQLIDEEDNNKITRRELMKQLRHQRNQMKSTIYDTDVLLNKLKRQVEDTALNSEIRGRYIDKWQRARSEQHHQKITIAEEGPSDVIDYYNTMADQEQRVHSEVELLINIFINETLGTVEEWINKYDHDIDAHDLNIVIMKNKHQDTLNKRKKLEETYATHEVLMKNWLQFKADRQEVIDYREKMTNCAETVQAWWRGLLVRLEMGPYKPVRKTKKKTMEKDA